jgi:putative polyketide hydroxylase
MQDQQHDTDVIVVGAGPVGLAAGLLLHKFGIRAIVIDRNETTSDHPKARGLRQRASELLNVWGFDEELRAIAMPDETHRFIYTTTLAGEEIARTPASPDDTASLTNTAKYRVAQDQLEAVLNARLAERAGSVALRRGYAVDAVDEDVNGVTVSTVGPGGSRDTVRGKYLIAADGVGSTIRGLLGQTLGSPGPAPYWHSIYWVGDLSKLTDSRPAIMYYTQTGGNSLVGIAPTGTRNRWITLVQQPASETRPERLTDAESVAIIRDAVGLPDLAVEVLSSATFRISADVVDRYRSGRVFLAGDAAHSLPPTGGFGINTGFADVHNLVWKLALVLRGEAPDSLLDSYDSERKPIAESNAAWSTSNSKRFIALRRALAEDDRAEIERLVQEQASHVDPLEQDIGFAYREPQDESIPTYAMVVLAARAPHAWIRIAGEQRSTLELYEGRFTLLTGEDSAWLAAARGASAAAGFQLHAIRTGDITAVDGALSDRYPLGQTGAVLVRPDGHVAWMTQGDEHASPTEFERIVQTVFASGLCD